MAAVYMSVEHLHGLQLAYILAVTCLKGVCFEGAQDYFKKTFPDIATLPTYKKVKE